MTESILIVDDDDDIRTIAQLALQMVGHMDVRCVSSGIEALQLLRVHTPDLILLDVMMPGMDGTSLFETIRAEPRLSALPIVFMTARTQRGEIERYLAMGAAGFIGKPFDPMTLADRLRSVLATVPRP